MSVVLYHSVGAHPGVNASRLGEVLLNGWLGIFIFFPISGYCIAAAMYRAENRSPIRFLRQRWLRIYPPYLASIILSVLLAMAALPFNRGHITDVLLTLPAWTSILTLTQVFTPYIGKINPTYWTLCYEEQFYLVMALVGCAGEPRRRALLLTLITVAALACNRSGLSIPGWFIDYWLSFGLGVGLFLVLHERADRLLGVAIVACAVVQFRELAVFISICGATLMLMLWKVDGAVAQSRWAKPLFALGMISYSLYLVHAPIAGRMTNLLIRFHAPVWLCAAAGAGVSVAAAAGFYALIERPFSARRGPRRLPTLELPLVMHPGLE